MRYDSVDIRSLTPSVVMQATHLPRTPVCRPVARMGIASIILMLQRKRRCCALLEHEKHHQKGLRRVSYHLWASERGEGRGGLLPDLAKIPQPFWLHLGAPMAIALLGPRSDLRCLVGIFWRSLVELRDAKRLPTVIQGKEEFKCESSDFAY